MLQEFEKDTEEDRGKWKEIGEGLTDAMKSITDAVRQAHSDASGTPAAAAAPAAVAPSPDAAPNMQPIPEPGADSVGTDATNGAHAETHGPDAAPADAPDAMATGEPR